MPPTWCWCCGQRPRRRRRLDDESGMGRSGGVGEPRRAPKAPAARRPQIGVGRFRGRVETGRRRRPAAWRPRMDVGEDRRGEGVLLPGDLESGEGGAALTDSPTAISLLRDLFLSPRAHFHFLPLLTTRLPRRVQSNSHATLPPAPAGLDLVFLWRLLPPILAAGTGSLRWYGPARRPHVGRRSQ